MHAIEQKILQCFARQPGRDISTSELVKFVFSEEYFELKNYIHNEENDKEVIKIGKRRKARLHRKLLYHINKLYEEKIIKLIRTQGRGEKYFVLSKDLTSDSKKEDDANKILKSFSHFDEDKSTLFGLETYEESKIVKRFDPGNWINKINSIIIETQNKRMKEIYNLLLDIYPVFNDAVALNDFEDVLDKENLQEVTSYLKKINIDTKDYNKYLNIILDLSKIKDSVKVSDFIGAYAELNPDKIFIIFKTNSKNLKNNTRFMKHIIKLFSENKIRINIFNTDMKKAPLFIGRAGTYTINDSEWELYKKFTKGKTLGLCASETTLYVDVYRFFKEKRTYSEFRDFLIKSAKALLLATTAQRKKSDLLFKPLKEYNEGNQNKFFQSSYNYIRLWNYDTNVSSDKKNDDEDSFSDFESLLKVCSEEITEFCKTEETIFKSCGIPITFKVVLSSAFRRFDKDFLSPRKYNKVTIKGMNDFHSTELIEYLKKREALCSIFKGGDRVRFFRSINFTPDETLQEFNYLMNNYRFPLITYDFNTRKGEVTLDNFI